MALKLNIDIESHLGPTQEAFIEIDSIKLSRPNSTLRFSTTIWLNEKASKQFYKTNLEDSQAGANGLLSNKLLYFKDSKCEGIDIELKNHFSTTFSEEQDIELPVFEKVITEIEKPYISFDKEGNEVTKYRKFKKIDKVQKGTETVKKNVLDYSVFDDPTQFIHKIMIEEYSKVIPVEHITIV